METFHFFKDKINVPTNADTKIVNVPTGITDKHTLFSLFAKELQFPWYFGENWDAFDECMNDLSFLMTKTIYIIHKDIPFKNNKKEMSFYLDTLCDMKITFNLNDTHKVEFFFPEKYLNEILNIINDRKATK